MQQVYSNSISRWLELAKQLKCRCSHCKRVCQESCRRDSLMGCDSLDGMGLLITKPKNYKTIVQFCWTNQWDYAASITQLISLSHSSSWFAQEETARGSYQQMSDPERPQRQYTLQRAATAGFRRVVNTWQIINRIARRRRLPVHTGEKSESQVTKPAHLTEQKHIRDASYEEFQALLKGKREVLIAFYNNDNVCNISRISLTSRARYGKRSKTG